MTDDPKPKDAQEAQADQPDENVADKVADEVEDKVETKLGVDDDDKQADD